MGGRFSHTWVGDFSGSILDGRFWHISKIVSDFLTHGWMNFSHMGGRFFGVNFGWASFSHLKNNGRFFHTWLGDFLTHGWAIFQGQFWMGDFFTSQK